MKRPIAEPTYSAKDVEVSPAEFDGMNTWVRVETPEFTQSLMLRGRMNNAESRSFAISWALSRLAEFGNVEVTTC